MYFTLLYELHNLKCKRNVYPYVNKTNTANRKPTSFPLLFYGEVLANKTSLSSHFLLKCLYQAMKISGHVFCGISICSGLSYVISSYSVRYVFDFRFASSHGF